jgi:upstream activation factor subunit UAF30
LGFRQSSACEKRVGSSVAGALLAQTFSLENPRSISWKVDGMTSSSKKPQAAPAKATTKAATTKAATKTTGAKTAKSGTSAFAKPLQPSKELAAVVGSAPLPRTEVVSKVWEYIKKHKLQNEANKREILADEKLKAVFGRDKVTMFEMNKYLAQHLK